MYKGTKFSHGCDQASKSKMEITPYFRYLRRTYAKNVYLGTNSLIMPCVIIDYKVIIFYGVIMKNLHFKCCNHRLFCKIFML